MPTDELGGISVSDISLSPRAGFVQGGGRTKKKDRGSIFLKADFGWTN